MTIMKIPFLSLILCIWLIVPALSSASEPDLDELFAPPKTSKQPRHEQPDNALYQTYNELNNRIRDGLIDRVTARSELTARLAAIRTEYYQRGGRDYSPGQWVFPLAGYSAGAIATGKNHGFVASGYDFFSGNRHGGHPAYDIFIHDRNQDSLDDKSGESVNVVSMTGGVVVAHEKQWQNGSKLRGGKYLWIYDPANELLVYYAHNEKLLVTPGTIVKPGDLLATVGRSGFNAAKRRSPTHLHFSMLRLKNGIPVPLKAYQALQRATPLPP
jgi:murein DD-endopeptidase MepM/ murein hydrolase activator NlpD